MNPILVAEEQKSDCISNYSQIMANGIINNPYESQRKAYNGSY